MYVRARARACLCSVYRVSAYCSSGLACRGVFQVLKHGAGAGAVEVQVRLVMCRAAQSWSGGLTAKCAAGVAVRTDASTVLETSYEFDAEEGRFDGRAALLKNGVALAVPSAQSIGGVNVTSRAPQQKRVEGLTGGTYAPLASSPHRAGTRLR